MDGQVFVHYDSNSQKLQPRVSWMEKYVGKEDPQYWVRQTQISRGDEEWFRENLETLRNRYNQSEGLHTIQLMHGCELQGNGSQRGFLQYGYKGRTFINFDKETLTWVAPNPLAQISKRKLDADAGYNQYFKSYLEKECIDWMWKYLSYGNETLLRTGEHLNPGWTFLLYGRISLTHSASLGPLSGACLSWWESSSSPSSPSCRTREALFVLEGLRVNSGVPFLQAPRDVAVRARQRWRMGWRHICRLDSFYPGRCVPPGARGGEVWLEETFHGFLAPSGGWDLPLLAQHPDATPKRGASYQGPWSTTACRPLAWPWKVGAAAGTDHEMTGDGNYRIPSQNWLILMKCPQILS
ncbi:putative MHC class I antigen protein [Naja naja]|nr:putative MHC class I antigen protein [Naja naja]